MDSIRAYDRRDGDSGATLLIVDDDENVRQNLQRVCGGLSAERPLKVLTASNLQSALDFLATTFVHVVLLDKNLKNRGPLLENCSPPD